MSKGKAFSEQLASEGHQLKKENISISIVDSREHHSLQELMGSECYCIERLFLLNDQPFIHFTHYVPLEASFSLDLNLFIESLYDSLFKKGLVMCRFNDEFEVEVPCEKITSILHTDQKSLLKRLRSSYDCDEKLIEYSIAYYNTDMHKYVIQYND